MITVLVDSDVLIEVERGRDDNILSAWRGRVLAVGLIAVSAVSVAEVWHGVRPGGELALTDLFDAAWVLPVDAAIGKEAGRFLRAYHRSHGVELGDALIAATAAVYQVTLWTRNRKHYPMPEVEFYSA